eukprot:CAMPEP_0117447888 /NCGR_PEP_ID=MMETSP0759-20121206/7109_1 /TAXON_ID=63605 /ORGANISM="Percolomonas cosmopolitus, Strain WS" /LENGTH=562 /DNA_ID=CAMNT_0005240241 /DNA_START=108 /DNA_END=1796 /DNA_ORIENTATION=+
MSQNFEHGDLVWARVPSYPWWPGEIYDEHDASVSPTVRSEKPSTDAYLVHFINELHDEFYWFKANDSGLLPYLCDKCDKLEHQAKAFTDSNLMWSINEIRARMGKAPIEKPASNKRKRESTASKKKAAASPKGKKTPVTPVDPPKKKRKISAEESQLQVEPVVKSASKQKKRVLDSPTAASNEVSMEQIMDTEASALGDNEASEPPVAPKPVPPPRKIVKTTLAAAGSQSNSPSPVPSSANRMVEKEQISDDELRDLHNQLTDAEQQKNESQQIYVLKYIDERCIIGISQLRKIKIARDISQLRKSNNEQIKRLATVITSRFKSIVKRMTDNNNVVGGGQNNNDKSRTVAKDTPSAARGDSQSQSQGDEDTESSSAELSKEEKAAIVKDIKERVDMQSLDPLRAYFRVQIASVLATQKSKIENSLTIACKIEEAVYSNHMKQTGANKSQYKSQLNSIKFNLRDTNNPDFCRNVESGAISADKLAIMKSQDMASKEIQQRRRDIKKEEIRKSTVAKAEARAGGLFKCFKCKSDKVHTYELQTRSADEPMTVFCSCICGHRWRM